MKLHTTFILAGTVMLVSNIAFAEEYPMTFESLDQDHDGYISRSEADVRSDLAEHWVNIDQNTDDQLDISEFSAFESEGRYSPPEESEEPGIGAAPY